MNRTIEERVILKTLSLCLQYPDEQTRRALEESIAIARDLPADGPRNDLIKALEWLVQSPLMALQAEYCGTFDLKRATSLALTYHLWGDGKERGHALAGLNRQYHDAGYVVTAAELPDHLPLVLEFLSLCPDDAFDAVVQPYAAVIDSLAQRLRDEKSRYAGLLGILSDILMQHVAKEQA